MTKKQKIARDFINLHRDNNLYNWVPLGNCDDETKLERIYCHMMAGTFGSCSFINGKYRIEVDNFDSVDGNSMLFIFNGE